MALPERGKFCFDSRKNAHFLFDMTLYSCLNLESDMIPSKIIQTKAHLKFLSMITVYKSVITPISSLILKF